MGDKSKLVMRHKSPRVETSVGRQVGLDKCKLMQPKVTQSLGDKGETSVNSCLPWVFQSGGQVWETLVEDTCFPSHTLVGDKGETSVNSCSPRHPE